MSRRYINQEELVTETWLELDLVSSEGEDLVFEITSGKFDGFFLKLSVTLVVELLFSGGMVKLNKK